MTIWNDDELRKLAEAPKGIGFHDPLPGKLAAALLSQREITRELELQIDELKRCLTSEEANVTKLLEEGKQKDRLNDELKKALLSLRAAKEKPSPVKARYRQKEEIQIVTELVEGTVGRDSDGAKCPCGGYAEKDYLTKQEAADYNFCGRIFPCCTRVFVCGLCKKRFIMRAEAPDIG